eukprot:CAMPEP_0184395004 /NCGR_PEP_ID=MMETSP0007-20130409/42285_1 /TAXON_ID=97485 /ORGANISM="Prymnesium parvum, Strain Texoma1" /LENGTH=113 /DNA_ID=CAMNT_0026746919 /DNA_START=321 /DNA_END=663 /DNA_ORIENTATION=-
MRCHAVLAGLVGLQQVPPLVHHRLQGEWVSTPYRAPSAPGAVRLSYTSSPLAFDPRPRLSRAPALAPPKGAPAAMLAWTTFAEYENSTVHAVSASDESPTEEHAPDRELSRRP